MAFTSEAMAEIDRERIDLFWAHVEDEAVSMTELVSTFGELVTEGTTRQIWVDRERALASARRDASRAAAGDPSRMTPQDAFAASFGGWELEGEPYTVAPGTEFRYNWNAPIVVSPHDSNVIYHAANRDQLLPRKPLPRAQNTGRGTGN